MAKKVKKRKQQRKGFLSAHGRAIESKLIQLVNKDILEHGKQSPKQVAEFLANLVNDYDAMSDEGKMAKSNQGKEFICTVVSIYALGLLLALLCCNVNVQQPKPFCLTNVYAFFDAKVKGSLF